MSVSLIPESAPFDAEQRAWLSGFLAGWTGVASTTNGAAAVAISAMTAGAATNGSHASNGKATVAEPAAEENFPWHDPALPLDERLTLAEGKPVERRLMAAMAQLDCGSCGYDCKRYATAIAEGAEPNLTLCSPGGKETARAVKKIVKERESNGISSDATAKTRNGAVANGHAMSAAMYDRNRPFAAKILKVENLNREGSAKRTSHVEICLDGSGLEYRAGDALGVLPRNCDELVRAVVQAAGADPAAPVKTPTGQNHSLADALVRRCDLRTATEELVALVRDSAKEEAATAFLSELLADEAALDDHDVLDVLLAAPGVALDAQSLVASLEPLNPRLYSIASSLAAHPRQVHLTVGRVENEKRGRGRKGVASTMLADRVTIGDRVDVFVQKSHGFALPPDPTTPIVMVGPGTGIAPFRAFLAERKAVKATGGSWLFFGDQRRDCDFLYESELTGWLADGTLTRLDLAFSRDQERKVYVQDRMREHAAELYRWLERGACFYVCGDASRMARDVDQALRDVIASEGNLSPEDAKRYVADLAATGRYCRDVY